MSDSSAVQRARIDAMLDTLLDMSADDRAAYLERAGGDDPVARREVESLLRAMRGGRAAELMFAASRCATVTVAAPLVGMTGPQVQRAAPAELH
jgi:hypothetical protein